MKIKHWQGYGCVNAVKLSTTNVSDNKTNIRILRVRVTGDHEYGIECHDEYTVANWLVKRFDKTFNDARTITNIAINVQDSGRTCDYTIMYHEPA